MSEVKMINKRKKLIVTFIIMLILVFLFNRAMYWSEFSTWKNKLFVGVISIFGVICIPLLLTYIKAASDYIDTFIANKINQIKEANLKGIKLADASEEVKKSVEQLPSEVEIDENCYYLDDETLSRMGIDEKRIKQYEYFIAKYDFSKITVEIISTKGYNENYTLTQINQLSKDD